MGVVAVACVAVVSAPMLAARGGVHHRGGRPAERHQYLSGVDFSQDPVVTEAGGGGLMMLARLDTGALAIPKGPPASSDDGVFSPFIGIVPPSVGPARGGLKQLTELPQGPNEAPLAPPQTPHAESRGLIPAVASPETPPDLPPPPILPPDPIVIPDPPPPPVVVVVVTPPVEPPGPPPPETRPPPVVVTQALAVPAAVIAAVPEPGTWAMLVLGFGAIGAALRRRRRDRPVAEGCC